MGRTECHARGGRDMNGGNGNHPAKGSSIKVGPIADLDAIRLIKEMLYLSNPMHYGLFVVGVNTNLRASDLVRLTHAQVKGIEVMGEIEVKEKKTGKVRRISLNRVCVDAIKRLEGEGRLFPLTVSSVHRLVKGWCRKAGLKGNYGSHTLRKTWGYHQRVTFGVDLPTLMTCFNHATQRQTLDYLCIQPEEVRCVYENEI